MKKTINQLYRFQSENISTSSDTEALREIYTELFATLEKLKAVIGEENKELLEKYASQEDRLCKALCESAFANGYSLATQLMTEALGK